MNERNLRITTNNKSNEYCIILGNMYIPLNKATSWKVNMLKSKKNYGSDTWIGIAPNDINQSNEINYNKCRWYLDIFFDIMV